MSEVTQPTKVAAEVGPDYQRTIAGSFQITAVITDKRQIVFSGHVYSDDAPGEINKRVDHAQDVIDRQSIRYDIVNKRAQIASHHSSLLHLKTRQDEFIAMQQKGKKLASTQQDALTKYDADVRRVRVEIESLEAAIAEAEKKLAT